MRTLALLSLIPFSSSILGCSPGNNPVTSAASSGGTSSTSGTGGASTTSATSSTSSSSGNPLHDGGIKDPCNLPGSVQFTANGTVTVPGGDPSAPSLDFLHLPPGFCAHHYGVVPDARQIKFAPGGELFVASPTTPTTGGAYATGMSAIVVLPDDDEDGVADGVQTFLGNLPSTQGLLFDGGYFYYQDSAQIMQLPYKTGDRTPSGTAKPVVNVTVFSNTGHWPKALDVSDDGHIYVGNGGYQDDACVEPEAFHGGILEIDGSPGGKQIAKGFRNPIAIRCARGHNQCFALELAKDYTPGTGREKLVPIREGDDWGFPCCATTNMPYPTVTNQNGATPQCSGVTPESNAFLIGDTPFGLEFEPGNWKGVFQGNAFVALHGTFGMWVGARILTIPMDPTTGLPKTSTDMGGSNQGMNDFATGWDDGTQSHGRPAALAFSPDGRLFVADDNKGEIFWIAPM